MISTDTSTATGVLTGPTQTIALGFYFMANTDLVVTRSRSGAITPLTLDSDYSVLGAGNENGGSITVTGQASGDVITIVRTVPYTQLVDLVPLTKLSETLLEQALDKSTMMAQQLRRDLDVLSSATIEEAPIDGTSYARKDAGWVTLAGGGDMLKSVYDTDNDGKVDSSKTADTATTAGTISGSITMSQVSDAGSAATKAVGTTTGTVCAGDDSRLSNARTPTAHASTHGSAGSDPITITISQVTNLSSELSVKLDSSTAASTYLTIATASTTYQPLDGDLTAIAGLSGTTGILTKTAANTWSLDTNTYLTTTEAASTYQPLDADLTAIAGLSGTAGLLRKTAADTWSLDSNVYLTGNETITLSGDATGSGTTAITVILANSGVSAGSYGSATAVPKVTVDEKGRVTEVTSTSIQIAESQVTGLGTDLGAKAPIDNPTFTTGITTPAANITGLTASRALVSDASKNVASSAVTSTELGYLSGVTSALQTQIDAKSPSTTPINAQTGTTYTLVASDAGKIVTCTNASAITVTVPASTFSAGQSVIIGQGGAGQVTLTAGSGMTLHTTPTLKTKAQYSRIAAMFDSASEGTVIGERATS